MEYWFGIFGIVMMLAFIIPMFSAHRRRKNMMNIVIKRSEVYDEFLRDQAIAEANRILAEEKAK